MYGHNSGVTSGHKTASPPINVIITLVNAENNEKFQKAFERMVSSMLMHSSCDTTLYILSDEGSFVIAEKMIERMNKSESRIDVNQLDVDALADKEMKTIQLMQEHFQVRMKRQYYERKPDMILYSTSSFPCYKGI